MICSAEEGDKLVVLTTGSSQETWRFIFLLLLNSSFFLSFNDDDDSEKGTVLFTPKYDTLFNVISTSRMSVVCCLCCRVDVAVAVAVALADNLQQTMRCTEITSQQGLDCAKRTKSLMRQLKSISN